MQLWPVFLTLKKDAYTIKLAVDKHLNNKKKLVAEDNTHFMVIMDSKVNL
jgi:hypothetical protein